MGAWSSAEEKEDVYNRLFGDQIEASCERYNARKDEAYIEKLVDQRFKELIDPWLEAASAKIP